MKGLLGFLTFLVLAEDSMCLYNDKLGQPLGWVRTVLLDPLPIKIRPFDVILIVILFMAGKKGPPLTKPMRSALMWLVGATVFLFMWGIFHGGDVRHASWQTYLILACILYSFTIAATHRTVQDFVGLAKWLFAVGMYRAVMCWISYFTWGKSTLGESGAYLTSHDDSIVWVVMVMGLILHMLMRERAKILVTLTDGLLILFIIAAIQFNSRRLAWVSLAMGLIVMYLLLPRGKAKKRITRFLIVLVPLLALYVAVGWGRSSPIFLPLKSLETVSTKEDGSTLARNAENLGLIATANSWGPLLGSGWGKPYICLTKKYDISQAFELWEYVPHNSILGILAFTGIVGAAVFWFVITTSVFFNVRVARLSTDRLTRAVGIIGAAQVVVCGNQLYGDMGIFFYKSMYFLAVTHAIALRLPAVAGVWGPTPKPAAPPRTKSPATAPSPAT